MDFQSKTTKMKKKLQNKNLKIVSINNLASLSVINNVEIIKIFKV